MPRRRGPKLGNKSKGGPRPVDRKDSKIKRWNKASDIPLDEEDQFHASRDEILLDGDQYGRGEDEDGEEEVFALNGMPSDSDEDEEEDEDGEDGEDDVEEPGPTATKKKSSKSKAAAKSKPAPGFASDDDDEGQEEEEEESWGRSKAAYYSSNAAELDSDDEEGHELEEQEAKRLQAKARESMTDADFGLDDNAEETNELEDAADQFLEPAPEVVTQPALQDRKIVLRNVEKTNPETLALAYDWEPTAEKLVRSQEKLRRMEVEGPDSLSMGMLHIHHQALLTYATTLAFYLHLRTLPKYTSQPLLLRSHPIFARLLQLKQALSTLEELDFDLKSDIDDSDMDSEDDDYMDMDIEEDMATLRRLQEGEEENGLAGGLGGMERTLWLGKKGGAAKLDFNEIAKLLEKAEQAKAQTSAPKIKIKVPPSKSVKAVDPDDTEVVEPPAKKRKTSKSKPTPTFDLVEPEFVNSRSSSSKAPHSFDASTLNIDDPYGEQTSLSTIDSADKSARRHTLRFHTSKIESSAARRSGARAALGGDDDVPYRERKKEKDLRDKKERDKKIKEGKLGMGGDDLDDEEPEPKAKSKGGDGDEDMVDAEGYYDLVSKKKKAEKEKKKKEYDDAKFLSRPDVEEPEEGSSGPRSLTRAILKNRGLTPHRSKSVRNPRVKKRMTYDKKMKKLASQKAVYKGGIGDVNKYSGEASGITKVVKSVRFGA